MKPTFFKSTRKSKPRIIKFQGYDNSNSAPETTFLDMKNMSGDEYPRIATRKFREVVGTYTSPQALFASEKLCMVYNGQFYYDGVSKGTVSAGDKSIVEMHDNIVIFPDCKYYNYTTDTFGTFTCPGVDYAVVWNNRIWGVKDQTIRASKLGEFNQWETFDNLDTDSYAVDVAGIESFVGIIAYQNHVTMFMPNRLIEMYGTKPSNFQFSENTVIGSTNHKSVIEVQSVLYYLHGSGMQSYAGGQPRDMTTNMDQKFSSAVCGTDRKKLYVSLHDGTNYSLFVYSPTDKVWYKEDDSQIVDFAFYNEELYALYSDGNLVKFDSSTKEDFNWYFETQEFDYYDEKKKYVNSVVVRVENITGLGSVFIKYDGGSYENVGTLVDHGGITEMHIPVRGCDKFQLKVQGYGTIDISEIIMNVVWG